MINKKVIFIYLFISFYSFRVFCQNNVHWGLGVQLTAGTNSIFGEKNLLINYFLDKKLDLGTAIGFSTYQGFCSGLTINYSPLYREKGLNAILSLSYTSFFNYNFNEGPDDIHFARYKVSGGNYLVPGLGFRKDFINPLKSKGFISIRLEGTYRYSSQDATVQYISGTKSVEYESTINNRMQQRLGLNIAIIGVFDFHKNKKLAYGWCLEQRHQTFINKNRR